MAKKNLSLWLKNGILRGEYGLVFVGLYLSVGIGVYLDSAARNFDDLKNADKASILRGLLGIPGWPIALAIIYGKQTNKEKE